MKKFIKILLVLFIPLIFLTGCKQEKDSKNPFIAFSDEPVNQQTVPKYHFPSGHRIYYAIVCPKGFNAQVIRVQIFKKDEKTDILGYSYHSTKDYRLSNDKYYLDYIVIHNPGHYIMQVFEITDLQKPKVLGDFWVVDR